jgi:hypothetical protein
MDTPLLAAGWFIKLDFSTALFKLAFRSLTVDLFMDYI